MDENSCEGESSDSPEKVLDEQGTKTEDDSKLENVGIKFDDGKTLNQVSERVGSSMDASASGPSSDYPYPKLEHEIVLLEIGPPPEPAEKSSKELATESVTELATESATELATEPVSGFAQPVSVATTPLPITEEPPSTQPRVRLAPEVELQEPRAVTVGPPPSYSFVLKLKKKCPLKSRLPDPLLTDRPPPPPSYSGNRGLCLPPQESRYDRVCNFPSLAEPIWRSHSQPALCPRCGIIILTTIHSHDSIATHVTALALCLFGCWPCCLLPYCMNVCKNTYHHCPICQSFLGAYSPW